MPADTKLQWPAPSPAELVAIDFLDACADGHRPPTAEYLGRLATDRDRDEFNTIVRFAVTVESFPPTALGAGETFGPYRIEAKLGEGGMGAVYRAHDMRLERSVALKVIPPDRSDNEVLQHRLEHESRVLAQLKHPSIVTIHEAGQAGSIRYVVMDWVDGTALDDVIAALARNRARTTSTLLHAIGREVPGGRAPLLEPGTDYWVALARVLRGVVHAVEAAHAEGVLHRDLKPANVILTGGGIPVVLDFGIAALQQVDTRTADERLVGSVPYLAPEQVREMKVGFDYRTDVYQLGLLLYELLALRRAFPHDNWADALRDIKAGDFKAPRSIDRRIPRELESICLKATELDPDKRYPTAAALGEDLDRILEGYAPRHAKASPARRLRLFARRHHGLLIAAAAALVLGLTVGWFVLDDADQTILQAFRINAATQRVEDNPTFVQDNDILGFEVTVPQRTYVYALSVVGPNARRSTPQYIQPLDPMTKAEVLDLLENDQGPDPRDVLELDAGKHEICLSQVDASVATAKGWEEGVWLFCAKRAQPWLARWIGNLRKQSALLPDGAAGIPFEQAIRTLTAQNRGGSVGARKLSEAQRKNLRDALRSGQPSLDGRWPLDDPKPVVRYFPLIKTE